MASQQFFTPPPVSPSRPQRRFTLAEANRSLPLVRRIVGDIVATHRQAVSLQAKLEQLADSKDQCAVQAELEAVLDRLQNFVEELTNIGCDLKDYEMGLIDFVGRHQGREINLCWKLGEESIGFFHEIQAGFAGRQPVTLLEEGE